MNGVFRWVGFAAGCTSLLLGACSGGGADGASGGPSAASRGLSPLTFLLFPNPQVQADGSLQTNAQAYAASYYAAIDPANAKDTLAKWKAANGFDSGTGTQVSVVFGDKRDLGYGRRMTVRQNVDGTVAAFVENYQVAAIAQYGFTTLNLDAAVVQAHLLNWDGDRFMDLLVVGPDQAYVISGASLVANNFLAVRQFPSRCWSFRPLKSPPPMKSRDRRRLEIIFRE